MFAAAEPCREGLDRHDGVDGMHSIPRNCRDVVSRLTSRHSRRIKRAIHATRRPLPNALAIALTATGNWLVRGVPTVSVLQLVAVGTEFDKLMP